jgi:peptidoglycan/LPS O-acetylase OafA/YrhL
MEALAPQQAPPRAVSYSLPAARPSRPPPLDALTSLRGLAALWVVVHHLGKDMVDFLGRFPLLEPLVGIGHAAVPYFFILSGFVLAYNYALDFPHVTLSRYGAFIARRLARIYPVHLFTLLGMLAVVLLAARLGYSIHRQDRFSAPDFVLNLFLVQSWKPTSDLNWNGPAWSISSEWFAYLLFPLVCVALNRLRSPRLAWLAVVLAWLVAVAFYTVGGFLRFQYLLAVVPTFLAGCAIWALVRLRPGRAVGPRWLPDLVLLAIVATPLLVALVPGLSERTRHQLDMGVLVTCFAATILLFARLGNSCSAVWRSKPLLFLGEVSYSLYMVHMPVLIVCQKVLPAERFGTAGLGVRVGVLLVYVGLIAVATLATYFVVENPARKYLGRVLSAQRKEQRAG